jgi:hypothetical protein
MRLLDLYERRLVQEASQISSITATDPVASENHQKAWITERTDSAPGRTLYERS